MYETFDVVVIGSGFFGAYAATHFAQGKARVLVIESEMKPWTKASIVNQARVHYGYHYPRSIATARLSNDYRKRFESEHQQFINGYFDHYYGIDKHGSLTGAEQFERFCEYLEIPCERRNVSEPFIADRLDAIFRTFEPSFDPVLLRQYYLDRMRGLGVDLALGSRPAEAEIESGYWKIRVVSVDGSAREVRTQMVLNATYASVNSVNEVFGYKPLVASYEMAEIAIVDAPMFKRKALTVMDGPYCSLMPYGCSSFHSLSSVLYTHHALDEHVLPTFPCQIHRSDCSPDSLRTCTTCFQKPQSNFPKMKSQLADYLEGVDKCNYHGSLFTIKTKLQSTHIDDARPTDIRVLSTSPTYAYVFSGKINSIYEIEALTLE